MQSGGNGTNSRTPRAVGPNTVRAKAAGAVNAARSGPGRAKVAGRRPIWVAMMAAQRQSANSIGRNFGGRRSSNTTSSSRSRKCCRDCNARWSSSGLKCAPAPARLMRRPRLGGLTNEKTLGGPFSKKQPPTHAFAGTAALKGHLKGHAACTSGFQKL